jgi:hypothetical protein
MKSCLLSLLAFLWSAPLFAQPAAPVPFTGATPGFHQTHTGQILFSSTAIPVDDYPGAAYLGLYTHALSPQAPLYFTAFLASSLTQALHRLAPRLPVEALARTGAYQFSFYVDAQLVYRVNLPAGTVHPTANNTVLHQALMNEEPAARDWGPSLWQRFLANGGERALAPGQHLLRLEIRPYCQHPLLRDAPVLAAGQVALTVTAPISAPLTR